MPLDVSLIFCLTSGPDIIVASQPGCGNRETSALIRTRGSRGAARGRTVNSAPRACYAVSCTKVAYVHKSVGLGYAVQQDCTGTEVAVEGVLREGACGTGVGSSACASRRGQAGVTVSLLTASPDNKWVASLRCAPLLSLSLPPCRVRDAG
eukprot:590154-Rhodomonas_salina.1